jgi:hypothetical protein
VSLKLQEEAKEMAMGSAFRQAADEEARAEVEVLKNRLEKTSQLNKKIAASLARLEASGKSLDEAVKPISGSTQRSQVLINSMHTTHFTFLRHDSDCSQISMEFLGISGVSDNRPILRAMKRRSSGRGECSARVVTRRILTIAQS